jgi:hypothetical protein
MEKILTFDGVNAALNAEEILKAQRIPVRIMARPIGLGAQCGFCVRVDPENLDRVIQLLWPATAIRGVYNQRADAAGHWVYEEIPSADWLGAVEANRKDQIAANPLENL